MALTISHVAGPTTPAVREMTFGDLLRKAADSAPDRLALIAGVPDPALRRQWTYAQLYREAQRTARALLRRFKPGERIAVWAQNIPEWVMLEFGAGMAGMVLVTVNPAFRANEVQYVLKQSRAAGIFVVDNKDRRRIDDGTTPPQLKDREWHRVRLERDGGTGRIDIFVDGSSQPVLRASDTTIPSGRVGLGSFDDTGEFRAFSVTGYQK